MTDLWCKKCHRIHTGNAEPIKAWGRKFKVCVCVKPELPNTVCKHCGEKVEHTGDLLCNWCSHQKRIGEL